MEHTPERLTNEFDLSDQHEGQHGDDCDACCEILVIRPEIRNQSCGCQPIEDMCPVHAAAPALLAAIERILVKWGNLHPDDRALLREVAKTAKGDA